MTDEPEPVPAVSATSDDVAAQLAEKFMRLLGAKRAVVYADMPDGTLILGVATGAPIDQMVDELVSLRDAFAIQIENLINQAIEKAASKP